jgi:hypothetical protein
MLFKNGYELIMRLVLDCTKILWKMLTMHIAKYFGIWFLTDRQTDCSVLHQKCNIQHLQVTKLYFHNKQKSILSSFKYNQQDATLYNILYCCQCSTCFRRFLRLSSSGAQNFTYSIWYMSCLLAATTSCCVYSFEHLMMGRETAWNMQSIDSNKEYCVPLHLVGYT